MTKTEENNGLQIKGEKRRKKSDRPIQIKVEIEQDVKEC